MKKKLYNTPLTEVVRIETVVLMASSPIVVDPGDDVSPGGVEAPLMPSELDPVNLLLGS